EQAELTFTATATDQDDPTQTLTYTLDGAAIGSGMSITGGGDFSWTPTELQGGTSYDATITVTDSGTGLLSDSETITITVAEVNVAPVLAPIGGKAVDEQDTLSFTATATDQDAPAQSLTFSLDQTSLDAGMTITGGGGFVWTPSESQGSATPYSVTITVTDDGTGTLTDSETFDITVAEVNPAEKVKVSWDKNEIEIIGQFTLPSGVWNDNLNLVGDASGELAGDEIFTQSIEFEVKGGHNDKWEYKDSHGENGNITEFKVDWKSGKFDWKGEEAQKDLHFHTHFIGGTQTDFCIHSKAGNWPMSVSISETSINFDSDGNVTADVAFELQKKNENTHVHFNLPFQLTNETEISVVMGAEQFNVNVADYYTEGSAKYKLKADFAPALFPDGSSTTPDIFNFLISLGDLNRQIIGTDVIGDDESWDKKDSKKWEFSIKDVTDPLNPLQAADGVGEAAPSGGLGSDGLQPILDEALSRWQTTGLSPADWAALQQVGVDVADLEGSNLGLASSSRIWIDTTAAAHGWFVDLTPWEDSEFTRPGDQGEQGRMDLLTTVMHELGHILGLDDLDPTVA
ncbi:MAG: hypothetical protein GY762_11110, partial [Proteobacteria bacterium]|nr:hypothetical protein [Pseudomonadota bacterium]